MRKINMSKKNENLSQYSSEESLKQYDANRDLSDNPSSRTRYYTLYSLIPELKNKVILDMPCGTGDKARKTILEKGARKVIASEISQESIEYSKKKDKELGIEEGQIEYFVHDAKIPQVLSEDLADIALCVHLFCFADNYIDLVKMVKSLYLNLKPNAICIIVMCSLNQNDEIVKKLEIFDFKIVDIEPWQGDNLKPRKFYTSYNDFDYNSFAWENYAVIKALNEVGFRKVVLHPYEKDPEYKGILDLELYLSILNGHVIIANK